MARTKYTPEPKKKRNDQQWFDSFMPDSMKKSGRTAPVKKTINSRYRNLGGFMIDPPETCLKQVESEDGAWWTDLALCHHCTNKCDRHRSFRKMTPEERKEDDQSRGIFPPKTWGME